MGLNGYRLFLKWALINVVFLTALGAGMVFYSGKVETVGKLAGAVVILVYLIASGLAGWIAWKIDARGYGDLGVERHISLAIEISPMIAMLGTVGGFLIAFGSSAGDVQNRVLGASTGLASTFIGIACTVVLMLIRHVIEEQYR